ncbi:Eco57I restriction-modification methylase domain-containing protein [Pseudoclavibacter soli]|uniref:Eco57I restriction-modification methylase domain-containing protein n=1 Tax=Pseudoclavibacter soli TaxID=452623 RepID=UPI000406F60D|nr:Eco57I restriction-modification methylase domain-containing protein [Pseudoclavibacter soli]
MGEKAAFALAGHNPDVLTCIANLSNDEVFTPPEFADEMLDTLAEAWAADHGGASIWANPEVTFLDPCTKSGVFLRQITKRLVDGLVEQIPDLQQRVDHVLTKQVFGIGITQLTALLARRSVYCSKNATGPHSIAHGFDREWGNIWFERTEHDWVQRKTERRAHPLTGDDQRIELEGTGRCRFCGASEAAYARGDVRETHAYDFIHSDDIEVQLAEHFGADMQFDVIIGNPPYQLSKDDAGQNVGAIYDRFVEQAVELEPKFLIMVIPARWMAGGKETGNLGRFRDWMLNSRQLQVLVDYPVSKEVFTGVDVKGGICYFLWNSSHHGGVQVKSVRDHEASPSMMRQLNEFDVYIREPRAVQILRKVASHGESSFKGKVSSRDPFGPVLGSKFTDYRRTPAAGDVQLYFNLDGKRDRAWADRAAATKNQQLIDAWKLLVPEAASDGGQKVPDIVLGKPIVAAPPSLATLTYLTIGPFQSVDETRNARSYYCTKFFRFLVSLRKITQHAPQSVYTFVPTQDFSRPWTDADLYAKYSLTDDEIAFIESMIRPMEVEND